MTAAIIAFSLLLLLSSSLAAITTTTITNNNNSEETYDRIVPLPIILIPGYAASLLSVEEITKPGTIVRNLYETYPDSNYGMKMMACSIVNDVEMDSFVAKENGWNIVSPMQQSGLYAIDNLNPDSDIGNGPKRLYMHEMIAYLKSIGYEEGVTLFAFPYDWRDSIINSASKLSNYVAKVKEQTKRNKVNIISHSMGGYVSKTAYVIDSQLYKSVNIHISFATPWQGTGRDWVASTLFGGNLNNLKLDSLAVRDVSLGSIAHYERMVLGNFAKQVGGQLSPRIVINGVTVTHDQMIQGMKTFLKENTVNYGENNGKSRVVPFRDDIYTSKSSNKIIKQIYDSAKSTSRLDQPSYFYNIIGKDKPTPISIQLHGDGISVDNSDNTVLITNISRIWYAMDDYISGDGLATYQSVEADGFEATQRISFPYSHNGILKSSDSMLAIKYYLEQNCHIIGGWSISIKNSTNNQTIVSETVLTIKETYNWMAFTAADGGAGLSFNMNGSYFGDRWQGSMNIGGQSYNFNIVLAGNIKDAQQQQQQEEPCFLSSMVGSVFSSSSEYSTQKEFYTISGQRVSNLRGNECTTDLSCPVANGAGVKKCFMGYLVDTCIVTGCDEGYRVSVGQPVVPSMCIEANLNWMLPIIIASVVMAFFIFLFIGVVFCVVIKFVKSRQGPPHEEANSYRKL